MARPIRKTWTESQPGKMPCKDYDNNARNYEDMQLGDDKLNTVTTLKHLASIFDPKGGAESDINNRVKLGWSWLDEMEAADGRAMRQKRTRSCNRMPKYAKCQHS